MSKCIVFALSLELGALFLRGLALQVDFKFGYVEMGCLSRQLIR